MTIPKFKFKDQGTEKVLPDLPWGVVKKCFQLYLIALMQALWKLHELYAQNGYGSIKVTTAVKNANDAVWANWIEMTHQKAKGDKLCASVQLCYYDDDFKVWEESTPDLPQPGDKHKASD